VIKRVAHFTYTTGRRIAVAVVGVSVLLLGIIMIVTPGPAVVVIPVGLAILAIEFVWARRWLKKLRELISRRSRESRGERADGYRGT
jgi:tellurite resistance protein TerC